MEAKILLQRERSIWSYKKFTVLLSASLFISIGNKLYELLLPLILFDLSKGSSLVLTSMRTAELLPNLFFGMIIGVIVDRVDKKRWALWMVGIQGMILGSLYIMFGEGMYYPFVYYILGFLLMSLNYGFFNTQVSLIKSSVPLNMLTEANAKFSFVETFVGIMGPVFLSVILLSMSKIQGVLVPTVLYVLAIFMIIFLPGSKKKETKRKSTSFMSDFRSGWHAFMTNTPLRIMTIFIIFINSTMTVVSMTTLIYGTKELQLSNSILSLVLSAAGVGGLVASSVCNKIRSRLSLGTMIGISILINAFSYLGLFLSEGLWTFTISLFLNGFATTIYIICAYTFRHEQTPEKFMGRISGITGTLFRIGMPISMLISGWIITIWGASHVFISACVINFIIYMFYRKSILWHLK